MKPWEENWCYNAGVIDGDTRIYQIGPFQNIVDGEDECFSFSGPLGSEVACARLAAAAPALVRALMGVTNLDGCWCLESHFAETGFSQSHTSACLAARKALESAGVML